MLHFIHLIINNIRSQPSQPIAVFPYAPHLSTTLHHFNTLTLLNPCSPTTYVSDSITPSELTSSVRKSVFILSIIISSIRHRMPANNSFTTFKLANKSLSITIFDSSIPIKQSIIVRVDEDGTVDRRGNIVHGYGHGRSGCRIRRVGNLDLDQVDVVAR